MRRLLNILATVSLVSASASMVVTCGKNNTVDDEQSFINSLSKPEQDAYIATSDVSKTLLLQRAENLNLNTTDSLSSTTDGPNVLEQFLNSSQASKHESQQEMASDMPSWTAEFKSKFEENKLDDTKTVLDFIDDSKIGFKESKNENGKVVIQDANDDTSLNWAVPDSLTSKATSLDGTSFWGPQLNRKTQKKSDLNKDDLTFSEQLNSYINVMKSNTYQIGSIIEGTIDLQKTKLILSIMSNIFPVQKTSGMINPSDPSKGVGALQNFWVKPNMFTKGKTVLGDEVGLGTQIYERAWQYICNNYEEFLQLMGQDAMDYLVGTKSEIENAKTENNEYYLINKRTQEQLNFNGEGVGSPSDPQGTYFTSSMSTGLYGKLINQIGALLRDDKPNIKNGFVDLGAGQEHTNGGYFRAIDPKVVQVLQTTHAMYDLSKTLMKDKWNDLNNDVVIPSLTGLFNLAIAVGLNKDKSAEILDLSNEFLGWYLNYENSDALTDNPTKSELNDKYNDDQYKHTMVNDLLTAESKNDLWFDDANEDYRNQVYKAFGFDGNNMIEGGFFWKLSKALALEKYQGIFVNSYSTIPEDWLYGQYYGDIMGKNWYPKNWKIEYENGTTKIKSVSYELVYSGFGDDTVTRFRASDDVNNMSQNDVWTKLNANLLSGDTTFKDNYNGLGLFNQLTNVEHSYKITWINKGNAFNNDFYLTDISDAKALIDGSFKNFKL
ncbi:hypothetical protein [Spiroplasma endosymbiont of Labia minor]|uniref:hypothetical protein n=1 Tax=Spiroplasma endosymbiont of Labia minor TaxID=3066305 RepID=UPI0030CBBF76